MSIRYSFYAADQETALIPVADGSFFTSDEMSLDFTDGACFLQFYDADGVTPITPTGGTIRFYSSLLDGQYLADDSDSTIDAVDVIGSGNATYIPATFASVVTKSKMVLSGITGASFVKAEHVRY